MEKITYNYVELVEESEKHVADYLQQAIDQIDLKFGKDYSKQHPELVGNYLIACSNQFKGNAIAKAISDYNYMFEIKFKDVSNNLLEISLALSKE